MSNWYYDQAGTRTGPVSVETLRALLDVGTVRRETLAWNDGERGDWRPLRSFAEFGDPSEPPPLPATAEENRWARLIALWPFATMGLLYFASQTAARVWLMLPITIPFSLLPYFVFAVRDQTEIEARGAVRPLSLAWVLVPPVYLFKRAARLGQPKTLVWVSVVGLAALFLTQGLRFSTALTPRLPACAAAVSKSQVESLFNQLGATAGVRALSADAISETSFAAGQRTCRTTIRASDERGYAGVFTITPRNGQFYYELRVNN